MKKYRPLDLLAGCFLLLSAIVVFLPMQKGFPETAVCLLIYCLMLMVATVPIAAGLCWYRQRHRQSVTAAIIFQAAGLVTGLLLLGGSLFLDGSAAFTLHYWFGHWTVLRRLLVLTPPGFAVATFAAWAIVVYSQRQTAHAAPRTDF